MANNVSRNQTRGGERNGLGRGCGHGRSPNDRGNLTEGGNNSRKICQVCGKLGYEALRCYYRFDHTYQSEENHVAATTTKSYLIDTNWYVDTGATDHITNELEKVNNKGGLHWWRSSSSHEWAGLSITHIGNSFIAGFSRPFLLNNIPYVPKINSHLLSVHKLASDNNAFV